MKFRLIFLIYASSILMLSCTTLIKIKPSLYTENISPVDSVKIEIERYYDLPDNSFIVYNNSSGQCNFLVAPNGNFLTTDRYSRALYEVDKNTGETKLLFVTKDCRIILRIVLKSGTLLLFAFSDANIENKQLWRSTDNSYIRFESVLDLGDTSPGYSSRGIAQAENGTILMGEYTAGKADSIRSQEKIWRSIDDGRTWTNCYSFVRRGFQTQGSVDYIRHIHVVEYDPYTNVFWIGTGDENNECQVYITKDGENLKLIGRGYYEGYSDSDDGHVWRLISFVFRPDCVLWGTDGMLFGHSHIIRYDRKGKDYKIIFEKKEPGLFFYSRKTKVSWSDKQEIAFF